MEKQAAAATIAQMGLTVSAVFVPFSQSRNKAEKHPSLNWVVTIQRAGRDVLSTDYSAGMGHCPSYNRKPPVAWDRPARMWQGQACAVECESGFAVGNFSTWLGLRPDRSKPIQPDSVDVLFSLTMDSSVLDYGSFEDWAEDMGYDPDSRQAESTYRACLASALKLRNAIGESGLSLLRETFEDY